MPRRKWDFEDSEELERGGASAGQKKRPSKKRKGLNGGNVRMGDESMFPLSHITDKLERFIGAEEASADKITKVSEMLQNEKLLLESIGACGKQPKFVQYLLTNDPKTNSGNARANITFPNLPSYLRPELSTADIVLYNAVLISFSHVLSNVSPPEKNVSLAAENDRQIAIYSMVLYLCRCHNPTIDTSSSIVDEARTLRIKRITNKALSLTSVSVDRAIELLQYVCDVVSGIETEMQTFLNNLVYSSGSCIGFGGQIQDVGAWKKLSFSPILQRGGRGRCAISNVCVSTSKLVTATAVQHNNVVITFLVHEKIQHILTGIHTYINLGLILATCTSHISLNISEWLETVVTLFKESQEANAFLLYRTIEEIKMELAARQRLNFVFRHSSGIQSSLSTTSPSTSTSTSTSTSLY